MAVTILAIIVGLAACVPVQYLSFLLNWKQDKEFWITVIVFGAATLISAPFIEKMLFSG